MPKAKDFEYYIKRIDATHFEVAKFATLDGDQPLAVYRVRWDTARMSGRCDCPAGSYRGTGTNDKHVQMVAQWVSNGDSFQPPGGKSNG